MRIIFTSCQMVLMIYFKNVFDSCISSKLLFLLLVLSSCFKLEDLFSFLVILNYPPMFTIRKLKVWLGTLCKRLGLFYYGCHIWVYVLVELFWGSFSSTGFRSVLLGWPESSEKILLMSLEGQAVLQEYWERVKRGWKSQHSVHKLACKPSRLFLLWQPCPHSGLMPWRQKPSLFLSLQNNLPVFWNGGEGAVSHLPGVRKI